MAEQTPKPRRGPLLVVVGLILVAMGAALPALLSGGPLHGLTRAWLAGVLDAPVAFEDVELSWRGPTTFTDLVVGGRGRFASETMLTAGTATLDASFPALVRGSAPLDVVADEAELRVTRDATGVVDWAVLLDEVRDRSIDPARPLRIELHRSTVRVEDQARGTIAWLRDVEAVVDMRDAARTVSLRARSETPAGIGALDATVRRRPDGATTIEGVARGFELRWYEPLLTAFVEGGEIGGLLDLDLNVTIGPGARFEGAANGTVTGIDFLAPKWTGTLASTETLLRCEGGLAADFEEGVFRFDAFHLSSSFVELIGDGTLRLGPEGLEGDGEFAFNSDCTRTVRKIRPILLEYAPFRNITGSVDVRLRPKGPAAPGRFDLAVTAESFAIQPHAELFLPFGTAALYADAAWNPAAGTLSLHDLRTEARWADSTGSVDVTWPGEGRPLALDAELKIHSSTDDLTKLVHAVFPGVPLLLAGPVDATLRTTVDETTRSAHVELASEWFDVSFEHDRGAGRIDSYNFFGKPFEAVLDLDVPVDAADPLAAAAGEFVLRAEKCSVYRNELEELSLDATLADGIVTFDDARARGFDGSISASGALTIVGESPGLRLELAGADLRVEDRFPAWFAACVAPVFAARPGPFAVKNDMRLTGRLDVSADGLLLREWIDTLRGDGRASLVGTTVDGSPLLQALVEPYGEPGPRHVVGIETVLEIDGGRIRSNPVVRIAGGPELQLSGEANARGEVDYQVSAESIFGPVFFNEYRMLLLPELFRVEGRFDRPEFVLPNPGTWKRLASEGRLEDELRKLLNS